MPRRLFLTAGLIPLFVAAACWAQSPSPVTGEDAAAQLAVLTKRVDELHLKIDAMSQQLLKMQQEISKPGVMIGETTPAAPSTTGASVAPVAGATTASTPGGIAHTVARGETLTSIAKMYKVGVEELQRHNQIEDGRKLQAGQTIHIPPTGTAPASPSPSSSP